MKKLITLFLFLDLCAPLWAATQTAASCSYADVLAAYNAASAGDTVSVPAGSCTWSSGLQATNGVILQGAGIDSTIITSSGGTYIIQYNPATPALNETFRMTGFTLNGNARSVIGISVQNSSTTSVISSIRIDHNKIYGCANKAVFVYGLVYGLIDNNTLMANSGVTNSGIFYLTGRNQYSWDIPLEIGTANSLYIEDNTISGTNGWWPSQTNEGTRWVFRNNAVNLAGVDGNLDWHGNQAQDASNVPTSCLPSNPNNARGAIGVEVYNNTLTDTTNNNNAIAPRGGTSIIFNNTLTSSWSACNTPIIKLAEEDATTWSYGACSPLKTDFPGYDPLIGYFWNNQQKNGANPWTRGCITYNFATDPTMIPEKVSYWADTQRDTASATTYWTSGIAASRNLTTCTAEDVYWETDNSKLYRCTATDTWTLIYQPYTYPHPLQEPGSTTTTTSSSSTSTSTSTSSSTSSTGASTTNTTSSTSSTSTSTSSTSSTSTTLFTITAITATPLNSSMCQVTWTTSVAANTQVKYGLTVAYELGGFYSGDSVTSHSIIMWGLIAGRTYHFRPVSENSGASTTYGADGTFSTPGTGRARLRKP